MLIGGIEAGGTKMVCAIGETDGSLEAEVKIVDRISVPTKSPEETLPEMIQYFQKWDIKTLGIGCFGPVDLNRNSATYGCITKTPKPGWAYCDIVGAFKNALQIPVGFDTDVNGAILGEVVWGAAKGCESAIYITVGTGIGVGVYCNGKLVHGLVHPEGGHILLERHPGDYFKGNCPFHANCAEGLAAGPAIEKRWGKPAIELADKPEVWEMEAFYLAQAISNYVLCYSPQKIVLWGGVMHQKQLFAMVREKVKKILNGYVDHEMLDAQIDQYIVAPALGENPGILGAMCLGILERKTTFNMGEKDGKN